MNAMDDAERGRFDVLVETEVAGLPYAIQILLQETPLLVEDGPSESVLAEFGIPPEHAHELCGLHSGVGLTLRSVEDLPELPETITIYRQGIVALAGGWETSTDDSGTPCGGAEQVAGEIRITILHEVGHHFGLSEEDLDKLGFA
jgi:predicted Zn-dependent protease with MMP-like domain